MKSFITWLYIKYVFLPDLEELRKEEETDAYFDVSRVDPNWNRIERALVERLYNTLH